MYVLLLLSSLFNLMIVLDMNLPPLHRDVYAISNPSRNRMTLEANFPTIDSFTDNYAPFIPMGEPVYLGGYSSGGLLALGIAARRRSLGQPVAGVILLDTFNTQGELEFLALESFWPNVATQNGNFAALLPIRTMDPIIYPLL